MSVHDFGRDLGQMHEVVITGRKAGMTPEAYTMLAQDLPWFTLFAQLSQHRIVLKQSKIDPKAIDTEKMEAFIGDVTETFRPETEDADVANEMQTKGSSRWNWDISRKGEPFLQVIAKGLTDLGIGLVEFVEFYKSLTHDGNGKRLYFTNITGSLQQLVACLRAVAYRRDLLSRMDKVVAILKS